MLDFSFALGGSVAALRFCMVNIIYTFIQGRVDKTQNKIFLIILAILMINSCTGISQALFNPLRMVNDETGMIVKVSRYLYFATHTALCPMFFYYVSSVTGQSLQLTKMRNVIYTIPFVVTEFMALSNPITNWVWTMDENMEFHRNWAEYLIYLAALLYFVSCFITLGSAWAVLAEKRKMALVFFFVLVGVGVLIQLINKNAKVEVLTEVIGFTGITISLGYSVGFSLGFIGNPDFLHYTVNGSFPGNINSIRLFEKECLIHPYSPVGIIAFVFIVNFDYFIGECFIFPRFILVFKVLAKALAANL